MSVSTEFDFLIQWHLTERCNLRCRHCYQNDIQRQELSLQECADVVEEAADMLQEWEQTYGVSFSASFNITGGEPLLRPDLFMILDMLTARKFSFFLLTNGTLLTAETANRFINAGVKGVQVSMEGPRDIHESIRGPGSFTAAEAGIKELVNAGIKVTIN